MNEPASEDLQPAAMIIGGDSPIRVGSPFAAGSTESAENRDENATGDRESQARDRERQEHVEKLYDVGPLRYTAMGAVAASVMVAGFAAIAAWWFPFGGVLIAALGSGLSIFGMYSAFRITSFALLIVHLGLFVYCYAQAVG